MIDLSRFDAVQPAADFGAMKLDKVALNPQPLPPKAIGSAFADLFGKAGITFGGKTPGSPVMMPEEDEMPPSPSPKSDAKNRLAEVGIIIVSGRGAGVAVPDEDEMPTPPAPPEPKAEAFALRSLSAQVLGAIFDQSIQQMAKARV